MVRFCIYFFQLFFKNRRVDEEGYILFVRKNAVQILIPKYGLEATLYLNTDKQKKQPLFEFNEEVRLTFTRRQKSSAFLC